MLSLYTFFSDLTERASFGADSTVHIAVADVAPHHQSGKTNSYKTLLTRDGTHADGKAHDTTDDTIDATIRVYDMEQAEAWDVLAVPGTR